MDWKNFKCTILVGSQLGVTSDVKQKGKKRESDRRKNKNGIFHVKTSFARNVHQKITRKSLRMVMKNYLRQTAQYNNRECCTSNGAIWLILISEQALN